MIRNDEREWMISTLFSVVTLAGFVLVWLLLEPWAQWWARDADRRCWP